MSDPLTAGEPLVPMQHRTAHAPKPPAPPPGKVPPPGKRPGRGRGGRVASVLARLVLILVVLVGIGLYGLYERFAAGLPSVDALRHYHPPVMSRVFAGNGRLIADLAAERRIYVPYAEIPPVVQKAFIAAEDKNFWFHPGIDPLAIVRAAIWDVLHVGSGRRPLGASTITQQVVKNILLDQPMTFDLKVQEAILALRLEQVLSKQQILAVYLNQIYLGRGSYGVEAAARTYFDKPLDELTLAEAAFLGGLPKAPSTYDPFTNPDGALARRNWVLDRMVEDGDVTAKAATAAKAEPLMPRAAAGPAPLPGADYFSAAVREELVRRFGLKRATEGGLIVRTSLDPTLQRVANASLRAGLMAYDRAHGAWRGPVAKLAAGPELAKNWANALAGVTRPPGMLDSWRMGVVLAETPGGQEVGWLAPAPDAPAVGPEPPGVPEKGVFRFGQSDWAQPGRVHPGDVVMVEPEAAKPGEKAGAPVLLALRQIPEVEGALVSLDPRTGRVLALAGGWSFRLSQFNRVTDARRQPGSGFKPFTYLTALEQGIPPDATFLDAPIVMAGQEGPWRPTDFEPGFMGPISMQLALEQSVNLATLRIAERVGIGNVAKTAEAFGVTDKMPLYYPVILGALDTTVMRMAGAYASFDELGRKVTPTLIDSVADPDGKVIWQSPEVTCGNCANGGPDEPPEITSQQPRIADAASTFQLVTMLKGVVQRGTGTLAGKGINRPIAGKTGTTDIFSDAWFNGFTPNLVTIVWVGFDTPRSLGDNVTGGEVAAPIWNSFMKIALEGRPVLDWTMPPGLVMQSFQTGEGMATDAFKVGGGGAGVDASTAGPGNASGAAEGAGSTAAASNSAGSAANGGLGGLY